jgi:hypothetical protein
VRAQIAARVCANYARLKAAVAGSACTCLRSDGGWYGVVRVPTFEPEDDLVVGLLDAEGVLAHPGYFFDFAHESFLVISLLPPDATFADGLARALRYVACADDSNQL